MWTEGIEVPRPQNTNGAISVAGLVCGGKRMIWNAARSARRRLADQRGLLQGDEDGAHAGHIFGLLAGFGVEVAQPSHPLPLCAGVVLIQI